MKRMKHGVVVVEVRGVTVVCSYDLDNGFRGSLEEPPEPAQCVIWRYEIGGVELDDTHLSESFIEAIQIAVEEEVWDEDCYDPEDDADFWGPDR